MKPNNTTLPEKAKPCLIIIVPDEESIEVRSVRGEVLFSHCPASTATPITARYALATVIIKECITELMAITHGKDKKLFTQVNHWQMIYRILVDRQLMPAGFQDFQDSIMQMGNDFSIPCSYEALKDIDGVFAKPFRQWDVTLYRGKRLSAYHHKYEIASTFDGLVERRLSSAA